MRIMHVKSPSQEKIEHNKSWKKDYLCMNETKIHGFSFLLHNGYEK
jgi:hypothetical protein